MNQIPNIEEIKKILPCIDPQCDNQGTTITVNSDGEPEQMQCEYCYRERFPILNYFHQQLQKAREEERGKAIELMKIQIATGVAPSCEFILKSIISSLDHSELDHQPDRLLNQERE